MEQYSNGIKGYDFDSYRLNASLPIIKASAIIIVLFNILLLIPDFIILKDAYVPPVIAIRLTFSSTIAMIMIFRKKIKTFNALSAIVTVMETAAFVQFLIVFNLYLSPDYMMMLLGMMILIIVMFFMPNKLQLMLVITTLGSAMFLIAASLHPSNISPANIIIGAIYLGTEISVCALFAYYFRSIQLRECIAKAKLEYERITDPLTRIGNRNLLEDKGKKWVDSLGEQGIELALVLIDVDNLKQINNTYGHVVGDGILQTVARITRKHLCKQDICVRWGGDEFILLLPYASTCEAKKLMERVRQAIYGHDFGINFRPTCCYGIARLLPGQSLDTLIAQADASMYAAKNGGKDAIVIGSGGGECFGA
ncbi:MAG: GGDEF domain-containing protein [Christensenellales bacterium]